MLHGPAISTVTTRASEPPPAQSPRASESHPADSGSVDLPQRSRRRRIITTLITPTILVVVIVGGHSVWTWQAERRLNRFVEQLRNSGDPVSLADLVPAPVPDADNAAIDLRAAAEAVVADSNEWTQAFFAMQPVALPLTPEELAIIRGALAANQRSLAKMREAMGKPAVDWASAPAPMGRGGGGSPWGGRGMGFFRQRNLMQLIYGAALVAHTEGNDQAALQRIEELLFLARTASLRPTVRAQLGSVRMYEIALGCLAEIVPDLSVGDEPGQASPKQVRGLVAKLLEDDEPGQSPMAECLRVERARHLDVLLAVDGSRRRDGTSLDPTPWGDPLPMPMPGGSKLERFISRPVYLSRVRDSLERLTLGIACFNSRDLRAFLHAFSEGGGTRDTEDEIPGSGGVGGPDGGGGGGGVSPDGTYARLLTVAIQQAGRAHYIGLAQRRTAALALTISLYRAEHDGRSPPADLRPLVPDYLAKIPGDPLSTSGESIVFVPDERRPRVYSVGEDGIDDGGWPADPTVNRPEDPRMTDWVVDLVRQPRPAPTTVTRESPFRPLR